MHAHEPTTDRNDRNASPTHVAATIGQKNAYPVSIMGVQVS
jgi:hypothetical protein